MRALTIGTGEIFECPFTMHEVYLTIALQEEVGLIEEEVRSYKPVIPPLPANFDFAVYGIHLPRMVEMPFPVSFSLPSHRNCYSCQSPCRRCASNPSNRSLATRRRTQVKQEESVKVALTRRATKIGSEALLFMKNKHREKLSMLRVEDENEDTDTDGEPELDVEKSVD